MLAIVPTCRVVCLPEFAATNMASTPRTYYLRGTSQQLAPVVASKSRSRRGMNFLLDHDVPDDVIYSQDVTATTFVPSSRFPLIAITAAMQSAASLARQYLRPGRRSRLAPAPMACPCHGT